MSSFWQELKRRKVIRVAVVYLVVGWAIVEATSVLFPALLLPDWTQRLVVILALLGFPAAVILAWAFDVRGPVPLSAPERAADPGEGDEQDEDAAAPPAIRDPSARVLRVLVEAVEEVLARPNRPIPISSFVFAAASRIL